MASNLRLQPRREYHIVVLGAAQFVSNMWIENYDPTIEDSYRKHLEVDGRHCLLEILDTAGTEQFIFSITSMSSLEELAELREQIIRIKDDENVPIVIVGNKSDLEEDRAVSRSKAFQLSQQWGNAPYYETSARRRANVDEAFIDLCRQIIRRDIQSTKDRNRDQASGRGKDGHKRSKKPNRKKGKRPDCVIL
ncbi:krev-1 protein [Uncinocarpus reesii 1704]|uniref:Krev-1 protein n=1 Tax=Uncinocarpus reesii (strain UAMH 1704) TaxID=336963 RepID=C4JLM8_UNCRE|nr:krev-1 protein [Uncinocarpus reesii 1704]EEP78890.1 krev-1 protein [Uncinocarpus reesii 1704]